MHILHFLSSPFSHFAHVYVLLYLLNAPVRISPPTECLSSELFWLPHSSSFPTTCINLIGWHQATENLSSPHPLYKLRMAWLEPASFLDSFPLKMGTMGCPETSVRNYRYSMHNNPEQRSSLLKFSELVPMYCCKTRNATWTYIEHLMFLNLSLSILS